MKYSFEILSTKKTRCKFEQDKSDSWVTSMSSISEAIGHACRIMLDNPDIKTLKIVSWPERELIAIVRNDD